MKQANQLDQTEKNEFKFNKKRAESDMKSQQEDFFKKSK